MLEKILIGIALASASVAIVCLIVAIIALIMVATGHGS